jgi:hypothetical protein
MTGLCRKEIAAMAGGGDRLGSDVSRRAGANGAATTMVSVFPVDRPGLVWLALVTGITDWISTVLPFGLGRIAIRNLWPGMLLLLVGCSALWAFEVQRYWDCRGVGLVFGTIWLTILVILFQICVAIAIVSVGWVLVSALITEQH